MVMHNPFFNKKAKDFMRKKEYVYSSSHVRYTSRKYGLTSNELKVFKKIYWMACFHKTNGVICPIRFLEKKLKISYHKIKYTLRGLYKRGVVLKLNMKGRVNGYFIKLKKITKDVLHRLEDASMINIGLPNPQERDNYYRFKKIEYDEDYEKKRMILRARKKSVWDDDYIEDSTRTIGEILS